MQPIIMILVCVKGRFQQRRNNIVRLPNIGPMLPLAPMLLNSLLLCGMGLTRVLRAAYFFATQLAIFRHNHE